MLYFRYHSTNCFFIRSSTSEHLLAIDAGWPGTLYEYARLMKTVGCNLEKIAWAIVTHFHMDHAGLISEFIDRGIECFVFQNQISAIDAMERTIEKNDKAYRRMDRKKLHLVTTQDSMKMLGELGILGRIAVTDYHSPDSITFISDDGETIIGDLPPADQMMPDDQNFARNWDMLRKLGARQIYPSHSAPFRLGGGG